MRAAITIAEDAIAFPHNEAVKAAGFHLQHEIARGTVGYIFQRHELDAGWRFDQPLARVHAF